MKILHYSLGFPPFRSGGLITFCMSSIHQQLKEGNEVALIWPGRRKQVDKRISIKKTYKDGIQSFEIINALLVPYDEGIRKVNEFMKKTDGETFRKFLLEFSPDYIHFHTFMGLHSEFVDEAYKLGIKMIFTTHDFFPFCAKVVMFRNGSPCNSVSDCSNCYTCNQTAIPPWKLALLQSPIYIKIKEFNCVKVLRKNHRNKYTNRIVKRRTDMNNIINSKPESYLGLRQYYLQMLNKMTYIHANSKIAEQIYLKYINHKNIFTLSITHEYIQNRIQQKEFKDCLRITYLGSGLKGKGFYVLKEALDLLWRTNNIFELNIFFKPPTIEPYMNVNGRYGYQDLESIFWQTDVLIVPSIWNETFGYTVLEALSHGVPVIVSDRVGAKDILDKSYSIIVDDINGQKLFEVLNKLTLEKLCEMNLAIHRNVDIMNIEKFNKLFNIYIQQ